MESITLYYRQGSSDKVYQASIEPSGDLFVVKYSFGRRGTSLSTGTKTAVAVKYGAAKTIYDKLVNEKKAKGYTPGEDGTPYQHTDKANQSTGIHCQLLNPIGDDEIGKLIDDPKWWMQEKWDGRRLILHKQGNNIIGINRLGLAVALPQTLVNDAKNCDIDFTIDGEAIGDMLCAFDVLRVWDDDMRDSRFADRYLRLMNLLASFQHPHIHLVETAFRANDKHRMFDELKDANREGVVFKHVDGHYVAGRPASGGLQLKYKFCETASFLVGSVNAKRSVSLRLLDGKAFVSAGNVTIPVNHEIPNAGTVVEVRYLYAFPQSGCIYQPVYLGARDDIDPAECLVSQLKYKVETPVEV